MFDGHITLDLDQNQSIKNLFLLYKGISEQYHDQKVLEKIKALVPDQILQLNNENDMIKSLLGWFKNDFMNWTSKDPLCTRCMEEGRGKVPMQVQVMTGTSWKLRAVEFYNCNKCGYEFTFPRYGDVLKIAEARTGRCSEWSMLFGGIMNALNIKTRIVHDFLDHCWNEAIIDGKWVHIDSTLAYPISLNHPYYYEQNWGKKYFRVSSQKYQEVTIIEQTMAGFNSLVYVMIIWARCRLLVNPFSVINDQLSSAIKLSSM